MDKIYFDYAATTPVSESVYDTMLGCLKLDGNFANPNSTTHAMGMLASETVEKARQQVALLVGANPEEIVFTSGATESDNLALNGVAKALSHRGKHIITAQTEHKAVLATCQMLEKAGFRVTYLPVQSDGLISMVELEENISPDTILVSIMHVNNELGVIQDIESISKFLRPKNIVFHVDAAQSAGKLPINLKNLAVDLMSFSGHKLYGPKGIGALYVKSGQKIEPIVFGGGQEFGIRAGTLATHQIAGMGQAFYDAKSVMSQDYQTTQALHQQLYEGLLCIPQVRVHSKPACCVPHIVNFSIGSLNALDVIGLMPEFALSTGSACNTKATDGSHVLKAIGLSGFESRSCIRASLGRYNTSEQIEKLIGRLRRVTEALSQSKDRRNQDAI